MSVDPSRRIVAPIEELHRIHSIMKELEGNESYGGGIAQGLNWWDVRRKLAETADALNDIRISISAVEEVN